MQYLKIAAAVILFVISIKGNAQLTDFSYTNFTHIDLLNYTVNCREIMARTARNGIDGGKLKLYRDAGLTQVLPYAEYYTTIEAKRRVQLPNPENPDDIYDLIDTVLYEELELSDFSFLDNGGIRFSYTGNENIKIYFKYSDFKKLLDKRSLSLLNYYQQKGFKTVADKELIGFCKEQAHSLGLRLYDYGITGKLKPYRNDSLSNLFTIEEITSRTERRDNIQTQNPANPNDPYDLIDSVITTPFDPKSITGVRIYFNWETEDFETEATFMAIAPLCRFYIAGIELNNQAIFWLKSDDYIKQLNKTEKQFWQYFHSFMLQNRSFYEDFNIYHEEDLQEK